MWDFLRYSPSRPVFIQPSHGRVRSEHLQGKEQPGCSLQSPSTWGSLWLPGLRPLCLLPQNLKECHWGNSAEGWSPVILPLSHRVSLKVQVKWVSTGICTESLGGWKWRMGVKENWCDWWAWALSCCSYWQCCLCSLHILLGGKRGGLKWSGDKDTVEEEMEDALEGTLLSCLCGALARQQDAAWGNVVGGGFTRAALKGQRKGNTKLCSQAGV